MTGLGHVTTINLNAAATLPMQQVLFCSAKAWCTWVYWCNKRISVQVMGREVELPGKATQQRTLSTISTTAACWLSEALTT